MDTTLDLGIWVALIALLVVVAAWLFDSFVLGRARMQQRLANVQQRQAVPVITSPFLGTALGYAFVVLLGFIIWRTMPTGLDLAVPMVWALLLLSLVKLLDIWLLKPLRQALEALEDNGKQAISPYFKMTHLADAAREYWLFLLVIIVIRSFIIEPFRIPSGSMHPTLIEGDHIVVNKFSYQLTVPLLNWQFMQRAEPQVGEVVVFTPPHMPMRFIKRIVAGPGDHVRYDFISKKLFINGESVPLTRLGNANYHQLPVGRYQEGLGSGEHQIYQQEQTLSQRDLFAMASVYPYTSQVMGTGVTLDAGYYFMMGDNRDFSEDSRFFGPVHQSQIAGRAFAIWMNWESIVSLPSFSRVQRIQ